MLILNDTPLMLAPLPDKRDPQRQLLTVILRCTCPIVPGQPLEPLPQSEQPVPVPDEMHMDDIGRSLKFANEYIHHKPHAEILFHGHCHAPGGTPVRHCRVAMSMGEWRKELDVFGDRAWTESDDGDWVITEPEPFTQLPLRWEYSFGGLTYRWNPTGRGIDEQPDEEHGAVWWLPNIEDPAAPVRTPEDRPYPAGFAPIAPNWEPRHGRQGTRDLRWATFRAPLPPHDFDARTLNAAPDDQQFEALTGDETIVMENLHPEQPDLALQLPGLRPRVFVTRSDDRQCRLVEIPVRLDTVVIDVPGDAVSLLWRGTLDCEANAPDDLLRYVYIQSEECAEEPVEVQHYQDSFWEIAEPYEDLLQEIEIPVGEQVDQTFPEIKDEAVRLFEEAQVDAEKIERIKSAENEEEAMKVIKEITEETTQTLRELEKSIKEFVNTIK